MLWFYFLLLRYVIQTIFFDEGNVNEMIKNKFRTYVIVNYLELIKKINKEVLENSKEKEDENKRIKVVKVIMMKKCLMKILIILD